MVAPTTTDPEESTTVPVIAPAACWAHAHVDAANIMTKQAAPTEIKYIRFIRFTVISSKVCSG